MNLAFLNGWTAHPNQTIGRLVLNAKSVTTDNDVRRTWILFGDPAMRFHLAASSSSSNSNTAPASSKDFHHGCSTPTLCPKEIE